MKAFGKTMMVMGLLSVSGVGTYYYLKNNKKALNKIKNMYNNMK